MQKPTRPNVLLVSLDTLRADVAYSGKFPTINRIRAQSVEFQSVVSAAPLTPVSHASILTGLYPQHHGIRHLLRERLRKVSTLATRLKRAGYSTGAVVSCPGLNRWYGMDRGFLHYDDEIPPLPDGRDPLGVVDVKLRGTALKRAPLVVDRALDWITRTASAPFFLFVHFFDAHWPYEPPEDCGVTVANPYEGEVAFMDRHLGRLLDRLEALGHPFHDMLVICLSDHGEDLGGWYDNDHAGARGHPEEEGHGCLLFDCTQRVPLWIHSPGLSAGGREVTAQVRLVDVFPTILDLLGLPGTPCDGRSLRGLLLGIEEGHRTAYCETYYREELARNDPAFSYLRPLRGVRLDNRVKVILEVGTELGVVYDLDADPCERVPLPVSALSPSLAAMLAEDARAHGYSSAPFSAVLT